MQICNRFVGGGGSSDNVCVGCVCVFVRVCVQITDTRPVAAAANALENHSSQSCAEGRDGMRVNVNALNDDDDDDGKQKPTSELDSCDEATDC